MPRENSLSDSEGRSLTPDASEEEDDIFISPSSANYPQRPEPPTSHGFSELSRITSKAHSRRSLRSRLSRANPLSPGLTQPSPWAALPPREKFRAAVRKVMSIQRGTTLLGNISSVIGAEPGIDPRRPIVDAQYNHIKQDCEIEIMDYSAIRNTTRKMGNEEFLQFMGDLESDELPHRDPWVKVRWINIGGISWDVIKALSIKYNLHPLALEDVFHGHARNRSKADYYSRHLFLRVLRHEVAQDDQLFGPDTFTNAPRTASPEPIDPPEEEKVNEKLGESEDLTKSGVRVESNAATLVQRRANGRTSILPTNQTDLKGSILSDKKSTSSSGTRLTKLLAKETEKRKTRVERKKDEAAVETLKQGDRVNVNVSPMFFFLFRDGTLISISPTANLRFTAPISFRLRSRDTVLRQSADPSLLLHAMLDLIVDKAIEVVDSYHALIIKFEREILLRPKMRTVKELHIMSGDLILHKRTLDPIKTLIYGLRRYDVDRCAALIDSSKPENKDVKVVGFMSHKAKIYLADVFDHMEYILTSLDMFAGIAENLIGYSFNVASYEMNDVMRRLTIATIVCLPLTLLTGYFGMNFQPFWAVNNNSDLLFWKIALPIMVLVVPLSIWGDLVRGWHYVQKKALLKNSLKAL
ncbi:hypothetical protein CVT26_004966 [Gymnopilus dilepis]|uniref:Magnesium transport protein CorA n=1 Tax=Gymnopilus dilepis TaxID=231916 RepID=A0A409Y012_9AGAR|nr:hypothetical protein CVT26_004966 [Gymnopilus dilepis]